MCGEPITGREGVPAQVRLSLSLILYYTLIDRRLCRISLAKLPLPTTDKTNGLAMTSQETFAMRLCLGQRQCLARLVERL